MSVTQSMPRAGEIPGKWCSENRLTSLKGAGEGDSAEIRRGALVLSFQDGQQKSMEPCPSPTAGLRKKSASVLQGEKGPLESRIHSK